MSFFPRSTSFLESGRRGNNAAEATPYLWSLLLNGFHEEHGQSPRGSGRV